jgi:hypothetical protein
MRRDYGAEWSVEGLGRADQRRGRVATYTKVDREYSADGTHRHIAGVCLDTGSSHTRDEVVRSIRVGDEWKTRADGYEAVIHEVSRCPRVACTATPYIATNPDSTKKDNLENLDEC